MGEEEDVKEEDVEEEDVREDAEKNLESKRTAWLERALEMAPSGPQPIMTIWRISTIWSPQSPSSSVSAKSLSSFIHSLLSSNLEFKTS